MEFESNISVSPRSHAQAWERVKKYKQMRVIIKYFGVTLCLLILVSVLSCGKRTVSECQSKKIELLLEDVFKRDYYYATTHSPKPLYDPLRPNYKYDLPPDSSKYFVKLYSSNLKIPDKQFYLHWDPIDTDYPDSVKLRVIDNLTMKGYTHFLGITLEEVNEDTTKLKISLGYGSPSNVSIDEGTITYSFDEKNCKWTVLDSTITYY